MTETYLVIACVECRVGWRPGDQAPACVNESHTHRPFEGHRHRSPVLLPDGTVVTAVSFDAPDPYERDEPPRYGLYLDQRWEPPWPHDHVDWPDFGVPADAASLTSALSSLLDRARRGERVEIGCLGGHGRTGTALACVAVLCGYPRNEAVAWVRTNYCAKAVETADQEAFVAGLEAANDS